MCCSTGQIDPRIGAESQKYEPPMYTALSIMAVIGGLIVHANNRRVWVGKP